MPLVDMKDMLQHAYDHGYAVGELGYVPGVEGEDAECHPGEVAYSAAGRGRGLCGANARRF